MPASPGSEPRKYSTDGAAADRLADWQARRFTALRRHRQAPTTLDDALPDDPMADSEATRAQLDAARSD